MRINTKLQFLEHSFFTVTQPAFACAKVAIETLEQGVKYVQS